jgi:hypothetical protein
MAVVRNHQCIFIHIPRTGGHTIDALIGHRRNKQKDKVKRHAFPYEYIEKFPKEWTKFFKFTFVRNPWDRVVSAWTRTRGQSNYLVKDKKYLHDPQWFKRNIFQPFNEYVQSKLPQTYETGHFIPQEKWLFRKPNKLYEYDFIGKFEDFEDEVTRLLELLQIEKPDKILRISPSNKKDYHEYYDNESIKIVKELYNKEIDFLGYSYD